MSSSSFLNPRSSLGNIIYVHGLFLLWLHLWLLPISMNFEESCYFGPLCFLAPVFFSRRRVFPTERREKKTGAGKKNPAPESTMDQNRNIPRNLSKLDTIISNNYSSRNPPRVLPATVSQRFQTGGEVKKHGTF